MPKKEIESVKTSGKKLSKKAIHKLEKKLFGSLEEDKPSKKLVIKHKTESGSEIPLFIRDAHNGKWLEHGFQSNESNANSYNKFLRDIKPALASVMTRRLNNFGPFKFTLAASTTFQNINKTEEVPMFYHTSDKVNASVVMNSNQIDSKLTDLLNRLEDNINVSDVMKKSGLTFKSIESVVINIVPYKPLRGTSYMELPDWIAGKQACVNVKNKDNECFKWAMLAGLHKFSVHPERVSYYRAFEDELNFDGIDFPISVDDYDKVRKRNPTISFSVYTVDDNKKIIPLDVSETKSENHVDLLLIGNAKKSHYVWIKKFDALFCNHSKNSWLHMCRFCLRPFYTENSWKTHNEIDCTSVEKGVKTTFPPKEASILKFKNWWKKIRAPFVIYADFEAILLKDEDSNERTHRASMYAYKIVSSDPNYNKPIRIYRGKKTVTDFLEHLKTDSEKLYKLMNRYPDVKDCKKDMTSEENEIYDNATHCHICEEKLDNDKVLDHCHFTGKYRGAAHNECNENYWKRDRRIPVFFHNMKNYDAHFIIRKIAKVFDEDPEIIAQNFEKYMTFTVGRVRFLDTFNFMASSLDSLVKNLRNDDKDGNPQGIHLFKNMKREFSDVSDDLFKRLLRKGVTAYDWTDSFDKFEVKKFPPIEAFYDSLKEKPCDEKNYEFAKSMFKDMNCSNWGEYYEFYLKCDVLQLADVFEAFRDVCIANYGLDPANYWTAPSLSFDAMLKKKNKDGKRVELELFTGSTGDMYLFCEKGIRGGMVLASHKFGKANNPQTPDYDSSKPNSYILYLDANSLYPTAMKMKLPYGGFKWATNEWTCEEIMSLDDDGNRGYIFEVDLKYPRSLHDKHNDYPLAPENIDAEASEFVKEWREKTGTNDIITKKLIPNLRDKTNYIVHYRNLKLYLSLGMKLKKVHRVLSFNQSNWLSDYIDQNVKLRASAKNDFEKEFFKLMMNSCFGKFLEDVRKHVLIKLRRKLGSLEKYTSHHTYQASKCFGGDLIAIQNRKTGVYLNKPIYVGFSILDLSKWHMYDFYYNVIKNKYEDKVKMLYTDTDSLVIHVETPDVYEDMKEMKTLFDFSGYPQNSPLFDTSNKKLPGKFKDEFNGVAVHEAVLLRPKMYSIKLVKEIDIDEKHTDTKMKAKGNPSYKTNQMNHEEFKDTIFNKGDIGKMVTYSSFFSIRSKNHELKTVELHKISLSCLDDKVYQYDWDKCRAIGHYLNN